MDIISGVEASLHTVRDEAAVHIARSEVSKVLKSAKPPQRNIMQEKEEALKELKQDENIVPSKHKNILHYAVFTVMCLCINKDNFMHNKCCFLLNYPTHYCDDRATITTISEVKNQIKLRIKF